MKRRSKKKLDNISQYSSFLPDGNNIKHDQFFKRSLEEITHLRKQFIVKHVPEYVKSKVANNNGDYDLSILATEHIPEYLVGETRADVLLLASTTAPSIILHFEQQTAYHNNMLHRMMKYKVAIIDKYQMQPGQKDKLPLIYQLVYHTGNTKWTSPSTYASSFETQDEHLNNFVSKCHSSDRFDLVSLQIHDSDALIDAENPQLSLFEYFMKNIHGSNLLESWQYLSSKLDKFKHVEPELLMRAICYCAKGLDLKNNIEELKNLFYNESEGDNGEIVMTSLQSMIEEREANAAKKSRIEGEAKGEAKNKITTLESLLESKVDSAIITKATGFSAEQITQLQQDSEKLHLNASHMLGFSFDVFGNPSDDVDLSGDAAVQESDST